MAMDNRSFNIKETLSSSQTLLPADAAHFAGSFDIAGVAAWLDKDEEEVDEVRRQDSWPAAGPGLSSAQRRSSERVLNFQAEVETVIQLLSQFLVNEWPAEVHLIETDRLYATTFVDFVSVKVDAHATTVPGGFGTELTFVNIGTSPDAVLFGKVVHACEQQLRIQLGELPEGSFLKDELIEEDLFSDLEEDEPPDFQALLAELVHCPSTRTREELLQALANLAGQSSSHPSLAQALCSAIGIFATGFYLKPQDAPPASLAETYPFAYVLRQAASRDGSGDLVLLKSLLEYAMQNADSQLVARELESSLSFVSQGSTSDEGGGSTDEDIIPKRSAALPWPATMQGAQDDGIGPIRSKAFHKLA